MGDSEQSDEGSEDGKAAHDQVIRSREQEDIVILYTIGLVGRVLFGLGRRALAPGRAWSRHVIDASRRVGVITGILIEADRLNQLESDSESCLKRINRKIGSVKESREDMIKDGLKVKHETKKRSRIRLKRRGRKNGE